MLNLAKVSKIYNQYSNEAQVTALENINLSFPATGMFFVIGKSGSGKSTLLNIIGGLDTPTSGKMIIDGESTENFSEKDWDSYRNEYIGFVFQEYHLLDELTVSENIALALQLKNENKGSQEKVSQVLTMVGLDGMGKRRINTLSGGQKQRVAIARAVIKDPKIILADEPTGALDSTTGGQIFDLLKKISEKRLVIVVSHDLEFAKKYGDYSSELADGKIINSNIKEENGFESPDKKPAKKTTADHLSFSATLKLSLKYLKTRPLRLCLTILLSCLSFGGFGIADTMFAFDPSEAAAESLMKSGDQYLSVTRESGDYKMSDTDLDSLQKTTGIVFRGVYDFPSSIDFAMYISRADKDKESPVFPFYPNTNQFFNGTDSKCFPTSYSMMAGRLPSNEHEICLTDYQYAIYQRCGFYKDNKVILTSSQCQDPSALLGQTLSDYSFSMDVASYSFSIVGILDTEYSAEHFKPLYDYDPSNIPTEIRSLRSELGQLVTNSYLNLAIVSGKDIENLESRVLAYLPKRGVSHLKSNDYPEIGNVDASLFLTSPSSPYNPIVYKDQNNKAVDEDNEIIVPFDAYLNLMENIYHDEFTFTIPKNYFYNGTDAKEVVATPVSFFSFDSMETYGINYVCLEHYQDAIANNSFDYIRYRDEYFDGKIPDVISDADNRAIFALYLHDIRDDWYGAPNASFENTILDEIYTKTKQLYSYFYDLYKDTFFRFNDFHFTFQESASDENPESFSFSAIGFTIGHSYQGAVIITKAVAKKLCMNVDSNYTMLISPMPNSLSSLKKMMDIYYGSENHVNVNHLYTYSVENPVLSKIFVVADRVSDYKMAFLIPAIILGFLSFFLLFTYLSSSVVDKRKEIGILRSLGASKKDIFLIFFFETLIIALICFALALIVLFTGGFALSNAIMSSAKFSLSLVAPGLRQVFIVLGIALLVSLLSTLLPIIKTTKQSPVEII